MTSSPFKGSVPGEAGRGKPIAATIAAMERTFEAAGIRFIENGVCFEPEGGETG
jgi:hypothetical protein